MAFWRGLEGRQRSLKSVPKQTASSEQIARKLDVCKLKLRLVVQLITWAEMELHIITSEHEVLNTLLSAHATLLQTWTPSVPSIMQQPAVLLLQ